MAADGLLLCSESKTFPEPPQVDVHLYLIRKDGFKLCSLDNKRRQGWKLLERGVDTIYIIYHRVTQAIPMPNPPDL